MDKIKIYVYSRLAHNYQILTGFKELAKKKKIELLIIENYKGDIDHFIPGRDILEAVINDKIRLAFDMMDGYVFDDNAIEEYLNYVDFYFKRSFSSTENKRYSEKNAEKILPLSFNYNVSFFSNPLEWYKSFSAASISENFLTLTKKLIQRNDIKYYEKQLKGNGAKIIFMCRLWADDGSEKVSEEEIADRKVINQMRISIIRSLKEKFGDDFIGGVENNETAVRMCPDLIMPAYYTKKTFYINAMKKADICIASTGLHGSIGWKFGEYVAAGKAIVSEKLNYEVIGNFEIGRNYLEYSTVDECVECISKLYENPELLQSMKQNNKKYYDEYCRPDRIIEYVLNTVHNNQNT